jgi:Kef-type K+ transport system membrane component KefB
VLSFITGSRAYGTPRPDSDVDLVILTDEDTATALRTLSDGKGAVRFGKLNLVVCTTQDEYAVWRLGTTQMLRSKSKFSQPQAKAVLDKLRALAVIKDRADSGE